MQSERMVSGIVDDMLAPEYFVDFLATEMAATKYCDVFEHEWG